MAVHGLIGVKLRSGRKKGTYCHRESEPSILGVDIVNFIEALTKNHIATMAERVERLTWVGEREPAPDHLQDRYARYRKDVDYGGGENWYNLLRDVQGVSGLYDILSGSLEHLIDGSDFYKDSVFCSWAYWIDWNRQEINVYRGSTQYSPSVDETIPFADLSVERMKAIEYPDRKRKEGQDKDDGGSEEENEESGEDDEESGEDDEGSEEDDADMIDAHNDGSDDEN